MATVKGDVHDIGKNIVGVVLGCNNYEVDRPRRDGAGRQDPQTRRSSEKADIDRPERPDHAVARRDGARGARDGAARHHAAAADRRRDDQPAAHGGEDRAGVHETDRPRARRVARRRRGRRACSSDERRAGVRRQNREAAGRGCASSYGDAQREAAAALRRRRAPTLRSTGTSDELAAPAFIGRRDGRRHPARGLVPYIDWTFFFSAWELKGRFPAILEHPQYGEAARELYDNAQALLERDHRRASC